MAGSGAARKAEARSTRDLILDAAERRFAESGFAGVSVRGIAAEAGLKNQASLYNHFRNKRALYEAALARGLDPVLELVAESARVDAEKGSGAAVEAGVVDHFLDRMFDYLVEHPQLPRLIQRAALDDSRYLRSTITRLLRPVYAEGVQVLASSGGPWTAEELPHLAAGLYLLIFGYFANAKLLQTVMQGDPLDPAALQRQRRFLKTAVAELLGAGRARPRAVRRR